MNRSEVKNVLGFLTGAAFLVLLVRAGWLGNTVPDRTVIIFAGLLYAYLEVNIAESIPTISFDTGDSTEESQSGADDREDS